MGEGQYTWVFFDARGRSKTYTQRLSHCLACGQRLERKNHKTVTYPV